MCGCLIALEGLDGAGTTTQVGLLAQALRARGLPVLTTREPSDGPVGALLRQALAGRLGLPGGAGPLTPRTLALLFAADREDHLAARVLPGLASGQVVLSDRYVFSSLAYQGVELPMEWVSELNRHAPAADLTLFVRVSPEEAARRRAHRGERPEHFEADEAQRLIARQYERAFRARAEGHQVPFIDGEETPEVVHGAILREVLRRLPRLDMSNASD